MRVNFFSRESRPSHHSGVMLIEVMVAILIFAFGILGIVSLQGFAVSQVTDAKYRSDASMLANQLIGSMWIGDRTTAVMQAQYNSSPAGAAYTAWKGNVENSLPGATGKAPDVVVGNDGMVTVTVYWLLPGEPPGKPHHRHVVVAQIK